MGVEPGEVMSGGSGARVAAVDLSRGVCYLVEEKKPELAYRLFKDLVREPLPGLVITRQYPERVRRERALPAEGKGVVIIPVAPGALEEKELALLERNLEVVESPAVKLDLEMREVGKLLDGY